MPYIIKNKENMIQKTEDHPGKAHKERPGDQKRESRRRKYKVVICANSGLPSQVADKGQKRLFIPVMIRWFFPVGPGPRLHSKALCTKVA